MPDKPDVLLCEGVAAVRRLHADVFARLCDYGSVEEQLADQARNLYEEHRAGNEDVACEIGNSFPPLQGAGSAMRTQAILLFDFTPDDARWTIAREHHYDDWDDVVARGTASFDPLFESTVDALLAGDIDAVRSALDERPELIHERSPYRHGAQLLHYVGSNGVEIRRQVVPSNLLEITELLLTTGADPNAMAWAYGQDITTYRLARSSGHPKDAGIKDELLALLARHGAIKSR
jgi:hypothetical protein